jgi:purine-binding chemotaxis protein CheW
MAEDDDDLWEDEDTQKDKYLIFHLAGEDYGIDIAYVTEIIGIQKITEVPDMPEFIKGVINLRGKVIPVMDVRKRFGFDLQEYDERTCIIVVDMKDMAVGLVVDQVQEVLDIPEDNIEPPPSSGKNERSDYVSGLGKLGEDVKILLDCQCLLNGREKEEDAACEEDST